MFTQYTNSHCFATLKMFQSMTMWFGRKALEGKIIFKYSFEERCLRVRAWKCVFFKFKLLRVRVKLSPLPKILATNTSPKIAIEKLLTVFFHTFFNVTSKINHSKYIFVLANVFFTWFYFFMNICTRSLKRKHRPVIPRVANGSPPTAPSLNFHTRCFSSILLSYFQKSS